MRTPHVAKSPVTTVIEGLAASTLFTTIGVSVLMGSDKMPQSSSPNRIVIYPTSGPYIPPTNLSGVNSTAPPYAFIDLDMQAHIWAPSHDHAWDWQQRLVQALHRLTVAGGRKFMLGRATWNTGDDTSEQGDSLVMTFALKLPIERPTETTATIETVEETTEITNPATGNEEAGPIITIT